MHPPKTKWEKNGLFCLLFKIKKIKKERDFSSLASCIMISLLEKKNQNKIQKSFFSYIMRRDLTFKKSEQN